MEPSDGSSQSQWGDGRGQQGSVTGGPFRSQLSGTLLFLIGAAVIVAVVAIIALLASAQRSSNKDSPTGSPTAVVTASLTATPSPTPATPVPTATSSPTRAATVPPTSTPPASPTSTATPRPTDTPVPGGSSLQRGQRAVVYGLDGTDLRVRSGPGTSYPQIGSLLEGDIVTLISDRVIDAVGAYYWWQVGLANGTGGWSAEGPVDGSEVWLIPVGSVPPTPTATAAPTPYTGPDAVSLIAIEPAEFPRSGSTVLRVRLQYSLGSRDAVRIGIGVSELASTDCTAGPGGAIGFTTAAVPVQRSAGSVVLVEQLLSGTFISDRHSVRISVVWYDAEGVHVIGGPNLSPSPCIPIR